VRDVVVIGAGPAGSRAAAGLASRGHDVVLLEEHDRPGLPVHCTGLLGEDAFAEFNLPPSLALARADAARFWGAAGQSFSVGSDRVRAAIVDRAELDRLLAERAVDAGVELLTGARAEAIEVAPDRVTVTIRDRPAVIARACVVACGANYRFHGPLGLGRPDVFLQSAQLDVPFPAADRIEVQFGREVAPSGFAWLVPFTRAGESRARIGLMTESRAPERFRAFADSLCRRLGAPDALPEPRLKVLPLGPVGRTYANRVLAVGDAAGLVKPTTGGGIYYGLLSGEFAAETLDECLRRNRLDAGALKRYELKWRQRLGSEIRIGMAFRRIAASLTDESIDALIDLGRSDGIVPVLQRTASFNWHRKAAIALLGHPSFRRIVFKSWVRGARPV
jgi:geranylgeranyl reductase family protein